MASAIPPSPLTATSGRRRGTSVSSVAQSVVSVTENILNSDLPPGFLAATAEATSKAPTIGEIRRGSIGQRDAQRRSLSQSRQSRRLSRDVAEGPRDDRGHDGMFEAFPPLTEEPSYVSGAHTAPPKDKEVAELQVESRRSSPVRERELPQALSKSNKVHTSGYIPPTKLPWTTSTANGLMAFWKWFCTPFGFFVTIYGLNVVAWGGMLFLLLCNASPAMCWTPNQDGSAGAFFDCNDINSPRRKWIEIDSQILNALFCVTGFGLLPWRARDLYYIMRYRLCSERKQGREKKMFGLRKLAGHYRGWIRLPGSQTLDQLTPHEYEQSIGANDERTLGDLRIPLPETKMPDDPLTGVRAPPTALWKIDFFIWCQIWNTIFQACLCGFMWGMNRYNRPSWSTGLFVALACIIAGVGGLVSFVEGKNVKRVEGTLPSAAVQEARAATGDVELGLQQTRTGHESIHIKEKAKEHNAI